MSLCHGDLFFFGFGVNFTLFHAIRGGEGLLQANPGKSKGLPICEGGNIHIFIYKSCIVDKYYRYLYVCNRMYIDLKNKY